MAKGLKSNGLNELRSLRSRTRRQYNLGRIAFSDYTFIVEKCNEIEARIIKMQEEGEEPTWEL